MNLFLAGWAFFLAGSCRKVKSWNHFLGICSIQESGSFFLESWIFLLILSCLVFVYPFSSSCLFCSCGNVFVSWCIGFCSACNVFGVPWSSGSPGSQGAHINTMRFSFYMLYRLVGSLCIVCLATVSALFSCCVGYSGFCHGLGYQGSSAPKAPRGYDQYHPLLFFELLCRVFYSCCNEFLIAAGFCNGSGVTGGHNTFWTERAPMNAIRFCFVFCWCASIVDVLATLSRYD